MGIKKVKEKNGKRVQREIDEYEAQKNDGTECKKSKRLFLAFLLEVAGARQ